MKKLLVILALVLLLLVGAFLVFASKLGSIVKSGVNQRGPKITQSNVVLQDAQISPFSGKGTLTNLTVGNPSGWQSENAFTLGQVAIHVEPRSLMGDHIVVNTLVIDSPEITYENRLTNSNLQDLMRNIQNATGGDKATQPQEGSDVKIEVKHLTLQNGRINVMGAGRSATVDMPPITLENLGTREGGLTPQQLTIAVMKEVTAQAIRAAGRAALESGVLEKGLNKLLGGDKDEKKE